MADRERMLKLAAEIVSAYASHNIVPADQLPALIQQVFSSLATVVEQKTAEPAKPDPAVPIGQSVRAGHIVGLVCGKHFSMLKRHLMTDHRLTPAQYRQRWGLAASYPLVAPNYAKVRSALPRRSGSAGRVWLQGRSVDADEHRRE